MHTDLNLNGMQQNGGSCLYDWSERVRERERVRSKKGATNSTMERNVSVWERANIANASR